MIRRLAPAFACMLAFGLLVQGPGGPLAQKVGSVARLHPRDLHGDVVGLANTAGTVLGTRTFDPYGRPRTTSGETSALGFTVAGLHTFYVGEARALVHNSGCTNLADLPADAKLISDTDEVFRHLKNHHGVSPHTASDRLHALKKENELPGDFTLLFGPTGDVWNPISGDLLGSLTGGF